MKIQVMPPRPSALQWLRRRASTRKLPPFRLPAQTTRSIHTPKWRPVSVLDEWVAKEARPISLRQLMVFGRSLTESRLISSANYVRTELPLRIAHRIRDMQRLPYVVVSNPNIQEVYELYYAAFETFRKIREVKTTDDNDRLCATIASMLRAHLTVIPKLAMGVLQCSELLGVHDLDHFMNTVLRSRISRRVIAEQHLSLTETFNAPWFSPGAKLSETEFIGEVFLKCVAKDVIAKCGHTISQLARASYGPGVPLPEIKINGHLDANFPYILSHIEYIVGELLRNSVTAVVEHNLQTYMSALTSDASFEHEDIAWKKEAILQTEADKGKIPKPPPIEVTICESPQHVIIRVSDRGGGIDREELPYLWSFSKSPISGGHRLNNLRQVPKMAATLAELGPADGIWPGIDPQALSHADSSKITAASSLSAVPAPPRSNLEDLDDPSRTSSSRAFAKAGKKIMLREEKYQRDNDPLNHTHPHASSLSSLSSRPPNLRLGMGLPLSRVYAEYWAGNLELHSLEGYGVDVFLQISKLGNKNEQLTTRAMMDAV